MVTPGPLSLGVTRPGKHTKNDGNHPFSWEKSLYMAIFHSYVSHYQRVTKKKCDFHQSRRLGWTCVTHSPIWTIVNDFAFKCVCKIRQIYNHIYLIIPKEIEKELSRLTTISARFFCFSILCWTTIYISMIFGRGLCQHFQEMPVATDGIWWNMYCSPIVKPRFPLTYLLVALIVRYYSYFLNKHSCT